MGSLPIAGGVLILAFAGTGAAAANLNADEQLDDGVQATIAALEPNPDDAVDVSRNFDRARLEQQTKRQAEQRQVAIAELDQKTTKRAAALKREKIADEREKAERQAKIKSGTWVLPLTGYRITSHYGAMDSVRGGRAHGGLDLAAPSGSPIMAVAGGVVTKAGYSGGCGNATQIKLNDGWSMLYCHQSSIGVSVGQRVAPGQQIGRVGSTGNSTGPHLHLEIHRPDGTRVNPLTILLQHGLRL